VGTPPARVAFDWITPRSGAGGATYVVRPADVAGKVSCRVEAGIEGGGTVYFSSTAVTVGP
jgi:hypothetical protein